VRLLEALGHRVVCVAANGEELVERCVAGQVDLAFTDFHMPVMDGLAAAEQIAAKDIPVVLISGHAEAENIVLDHEPVVTLIRKPATAESLQDAVRKAMSEHRARSQSAERSPAPR
jgi:response regulator NasT